jgi:hypothetical protein
MVKKIQIKQMIRLDKIKFVTSLCNVQLVENEKWQTTTQNGEIISMKFKQERPCLVQIDVHFKEEEITIEFTGKILKDDYPLLINKYTISKCFAAINELGLCVLNVETVLSNSKVLKCDVTKDIWGVDVEDFRNYATSHIVNRKKWNIRCFPHKSNFLIEKEVATPRLRRKMTVYEKGNELKNHKNSTFLNWVERPDKMNEYFQGCVRFELALVSCSAIRQELDIQDCTLNSVINSSENPIGEFFDQVLREDTTIIPEINSMKMYDKLCTLMVNNWDLKAIEEKIRQLYPKSYHSHYLDEYRILIDARQKAKNGSTYDITQIFDDTDVSEMHVIDVDENYWVPSTLEDGLHLTDRKTSKMDFIIDVLR